VTDTGNVRITSLSGNNITVNTLVNGNIVADGNINASMPQSKWTMNFSDMGKNTLVHGIMQFPDLAQLEQTLAMGACLVSADQQAYPHNDFNLAAGPRSGVILCAKR